MWYRVLIIISTQLSQRERAYSVQIRNDPHNSFRAEKLLALDVDLVGVTRLG